MIEIVAETPDTVTLRRGDYEALLSAAEDTIDEAAARAGRAYEASVGWESAKATYLTGDEMQRLLDGESPVRVWRERRGLTQRALAQAAGIGASYLAEIEGGKKPGSAVALKRLAEGLGVPVGSLIP